MEKKRNKKAAKGRTYETCGKSFPTRKAADRYARNIANATGTRAPVYETTGAAEAQANNICQNCGKAFREDQLAEITHGFWERVSPGEIMPSGECPDCGALCTPTENAVTRSKPYVLITVSGGVADIGINEGAEVDILDYDNIRAGGEEEIAKLSDRERKYFDQNK